MKLGAVEAGGTKFVVAIGNELGEIIERESFSTRIPKETVADIISFFDGKDIEALGVGSFGPIDLDVNSPTYGYITTTPKPNWGNIDLIGMLKKQFSIPIGFDTDVNVAALGEITFGSAKGLDSCLYLTVGTGIGGGAIVEGKLLHGLLHPEMGHIRLVRRKDDPYHGKCPYHDDCFEGLASGPAIEERWGRKAIEIEEAHPAWDLEAYYIGQALANYILILSPKKIILGGGVMKQSQLFPMIHQYVKQFLDGYIQKKEILESIEEYIVYPKLDDNAAICGGLSLAINALNEK